MRKKNIGEKCSVLECTRIEERAGMCGSHYQLSWRARKPERLQKYNSRDYRRSLGGPCVGLNCGKVGMDKWYGKLCYACYARKNYMKNAEIRINYQREFSRGYLKTPKGRYSILLSQAHSKKKECDITIDDYFELVHRTCYYCDGTLPQSGIGLDRLDNSIGYLRSNVVPCCTECNRLLGNRLTPGETLFIVRALRELRGVAGSPWKQ